MYLDEYWYKNFIERFEKIVDEFKRYIKCHRAVGEEMSDYGDLRGNIEDAKLLTDGIKNFLSTSVRSYGESDLIDNQIRQDCLKIVDDLNNKYNEKLKIIKQNGYYDQYVITEIENICSQAKQTQSMEQLPEIKKVIDDYIKEKNDRLTRALRSTFNDYIVELKTSLNKNFMIIKKICLQQEIEKIDRLNAQREENENE